MSELSTGQESATATIVGRYGESQQVILAPTPHSPGTWGAWFAEHRVACMIPRARDNGSLSASGASLIEKVADRIASGEFDAPQPSLVTGAVARIHGDLWSGNVLWARAGDLDWALPQAGRGARGKEDPQPASEKRETTSSSAHDVVGVLIDPMAHGGHAETDLAHLGVFGQPYLDDIYAGYQEVSALAPNWEERVGLSVLHMIVMHAAIFGGGYGLEATHIARRYV